MDLFPTSLRLLGRPALVVGGGTVAARHAKALLDAGAQVTLVAPVLCPAAAELADAQLLNWVPRRYVSADVAADWAGKWFAVAATGEAALDALVAADADAQRVWCVNESDATGSAAMSTSPNSAGSLGAEATHAQPRELRAGRVALVGGGPGAEDLITVRGQRLLAEADVVVADRLGPRGLLATLGKDVKIIEVGKTPGHHPVTQREINAILVSEAKQGKRVVRLKGGDPYVLGRGGEEAIACRENGVDVEVVPGVTSAVSVPAAAGIPVTHRGLAKAFTMISGHEELSNVPAGSDHTVVLLMGVGTLNRSVPILAAAGRGNDCPVAIIENGFAKDQRVTIGTLGTILDQAQARKVRNPAVVVVGDVVRVSPLAPPELATVSYGTRETLSTLS